MNKLVTLKFDLSKPEDFNAYNSIEKIGVTHQAILDFKSFLEKEKVNDYLDVMVKTFSDKGIQI